MAVTDEVLRYADDPLAPNTAVAMAQLWRALVAIVALDASLERGLPGYESACARHAACALLPAVRLALASSGSFADAIELDKQPSLVTGNREIVWCEPDADWDPKARDRHASSLAGGPVRHTIAELHALLLAVSTTSLAPNV